ncbi:MAG: hypothetical protein KDC10_05890 [Calditrichaeota bacterium]|nr:hypothetical protein [Candidatus Cloacimonadota bacterium]MCA9785822.1 hypothetical protein [Candidatus Cloacimonadota bacterium]MCB1046715.1 hypothetical protein [Calditrichota bacterium]MCB9474503.1 hypothetical protein [Candidatus Delongbacteria bacterium]
MEGTTGPNGPSPSVTLQLESLLSMQREGRYEDVQNRCKALYESEKHQMDNAAAILKCWANVLVCLGTYDVAIGHFKQASELFANRGNNQESWYCADAARTVQERESLPVEFVEFVRTTSGGTLDYPRNFPQ